MRLKGRDRVVENKGLVGVDQRLDDLIVVANGVHMRPVEVDIGAGLGTVRRSAKVHRRRVDICCGHI